jgi:hypothetical protein
MFMNRSTYRREWYLRNRETILAKQKEYSETHKEQIKEYQANYRANNEDSLKLYKQNYHQVHYKSLKEKLLDILGSKCAKCAFDDARALQIDHISGGGSKHRVTPGTSGGSYYKSILNDPDILTKYQTLCANCNMVKRYENDEF